MRFADASTKVPCGKATGANGQAGAIAGRSSAIAPISGARDGWGGKLYELAAGAAGVAAAGVLAGAAVALVPPVAAGAPETA